MTDVPTPLHVDWPDRFGSLPYGYMAGLMRDSIGDMLPGHERTLTLPDNGFRRREAYRHLRSFAHRMWGSDCKLTVTRWGGPTITVRRLEAFQTATGQ